VVYHSGVELYCEIRMCSLWSCLFTFTNVYKCGVIMTSSAAMNT